MSALLYQQAFDRIRAEYVEMPGMRLTPAQVHRLSGVATAICKLVLDDLVRAKFLHLDPDGSYSRGSGSDPRMRTARVHWNVGRRDLPPRQSQSATRASKSPKTG